MDTDEKMYTSVGICMYLYKHTIKLGESIKHACAVCKIIWQQKLQSDF